MQPIWDISVVCLASLNPRFGLYELTTTYEGYPVYTRAASKQNLFFQSEFRGWKYAHRIIRWIIGPTVGKSSVSEPHKSRTRRVRSLVNEFQH